jgi:hypothetical protein
LALKRRARLKSRYATEEVVALFFKHHLYGIWHLHELMTLILILSLLLFQQPAQQPSRPTDPNDPMPPPNIDYFVGAWTFEWNVPESPLGPAGKFKGKETYKKTPNGDYESEIEGEGPQGAFKARATTTYSEKEKSVTRSETGLFGVPIVKTGPIGGDLGGYYTIFWETQPIKKDGKTIKLKGKTLMLSPANYRLQVQISVDGGPYTNFGNPWFRKTEGK